MFKEFHKRYQTAVSLTTASSDFFKLNSTEFAKKANLQNLKQFFKLSNFYRPVHQDPQLLGRPPKAFRLFLFETVVRSEIAFRRPCRRCCDRERRELSLRLYKKLRLDSQNEELKKRLSKVFNIYKLSIEVARK